MTTDFPPLRNPVNDAKGVAEALRGLGFEVTERLNLSQVDMKREIDSFGGAIRGGGVSLFYYAGHGVQVDGRNYLIPVGANIKSERDVEYEAVRVGRVLGKMADAENRINIVILDACRDNPFERSFRTPQNGLAYMDAPRGTVIAYATAPGKTAYDGDGEHGIYTEALLKALKMPGLTLEKVFKTVRSRVYSAAKTMGFEQIPWEATSMMGDFYFIAPSQQAAPVVPSVAEESKAPKPGDVWVEPVTGMEFVWVPGGCYEMGCGSWDTFKGDNKENLCYTSELPLHEVCVDGVWIGKYEVTQGQWEKVMGGNPSYFKRGDNYPVEKVSWNDAKDFIYKLNSRSRGGYEFRLPSEAEWEYACRSGGKAEKYSGGSDVDRFAWYEGNSGGSTHPVGTKAANGLGLYDMSGNVYEWCEDNYAEDAYGKHPRNNPIYTSGGSDRVVRGGSWDNSTGGRAVCGSVAASRPTAGSGDVGFRLLRTP